MSRALHWAEKELILWKGRRGYSAMQIADLIGRTPDIVRRTASQAGVALARDAEKGGALSGNRNGVATWFRAQ